MQGVTANWVGQSFVLPKCSASKENKSRIRRTKEERRTMVMSFIKKYQSSNNGKFPSLNLTHKEVGGSFYTIREIVRDIIQENKVLGPGNPSSKLLNLEYHLEKEADNDSSLDVNGNFSISAFGNGIDHHEVDSSMEQQEISSEENTAINKPGLQVMFKTCLNENFSWQVKNAETSLKENSANGIVLHEKLINNGAKESNIHPLTANKDDAWGSDEQLNAEVQPNTREDIGIQYAKQSLELYPTVSGTFLVKSEQKNEGTHNNISVTTRHFEVSTNISETSVAESLPGTCVRFTGFVDDQSNCGAGHDNHKVLTLVDDILDEGLSSKTVVLAASNTSQISRSAHKVHSPSEPFVKGTAIYSSELETLGSSREIASDSNSSGDVPFILCDKGLFTTSAQSREIASSSERGIDAAEGKSVGGFVLQTTRSPALGATENDRHLVDKSNIFVDAVKESENASNKLLEPVIQETDHSDVKSEKQSEAFSTVNGGGFMSSSVKETKESETSETNSLWAAVKAFASSFIKFWSE